MLRYNSFCRNGGVFPLSLYPVIVLLCHLPVALFGQQIAIPRIELMPNLPQPYEMRNWKQVASGYDSLVFDLNAGGQFLPVIYRQSNTANYPNHDSFGIHTYVGTFSPNSGEAITGLPAVIGATLAGIGKSSQNGEDWVLMCEEYFNRRPEENLYLNAPVAGSGEDWWYETMPNIFFYQLYHLYRGTGDFEYQFTTVADQWLLATAAMGGSSTPWNEAFMNYRAWSFPSMTPLNSGVKEPEAAGAIAWLLLHGWLETGDDAYRIGAEWAMEFLTQWNSNPSYELQLPYGVYAAAKMNARLGTQYDTEKLLNWCFEVGPLRQWGAIVGTWGGLDVSGLIGEVNGNEYAFLMNGFQQAGALLPMCRYDDRFTRAIGKWVLNLANASRLFYPNYLPPEYQDSEDWSFQYDPHSYIGHEALREQQFGNSPYATGDAISGGWAQTNLGLYGSSHVGILGGIIDTTDVAGILKLDMLSTDFFRAEAYPTYLLYNPFPVAGDITMDLGSTSYDLYDAAGNNFVQTGVSGVIALQIPPDEALQLVLAPAGGAISYDLDEMSIDGVVVDYHSGQSVANYPPRIKALAARQTVLFIGDSLDVFCSAEDRNGDILSYVWAASSGHLAGAGSKVLWTAPDSAGNSEISCTVQDGNGGETVASIGITVSDNRVPVISAITATPAIVDFGQSTTLTCLAGDPDSDSLSFNWSAGSGIFSGSGPEVSWQAPLSPGYIPIRCLVSDGRGGETTDSTAVTVGRLVGQYTFSGNASDESGFNNHGIVSGAGATADRFGNPNSAYSFDGLDDVIRVPVHPSMNFGTDITITFWMHKTEFTGLEEFPISHGSWQNRWKVSIIPNRQLRWTINTEAAIYDLDSPGVLIPDSLYFVAVTYGDGQAGMYLNSQEVATVAATGVLRPTSLDLTMGQMVSGNTQYGFRGILDDVRIYNRALSAAEIAALYTLTGIDEATPAVIPTELRLLQNYPNPFNPETVISYRLPAFAVVKLSLFNVLGEAVRTLVQEEQQPGIYDVQWDGRDNAGKPVASGVYFYRLEAGRENLIRRMLLIR